MCIEHFVGSEGFPCSRFHFIVVPTMSQAEEEEKGAKVGRWAYLVRGVFEAGIPKRPQELGTETALHWGVTLWSLWGKLGNWTEKRGSQTRVWAQAEVVRVGFSLGLWELWGELSLRIVPRELGFPVLVLDSPWVIDCGSSNLGKMTFSSLRSVPQSRVGESGRPVAVSAVGVAIGIWMHPGPYIALNVWQYCELVR